MRSIRKFDAEHPPTNSKLSAWLRERGVALGDEQAVMGILIQYIDDTLGAIFDDAGGITSFLQIHQHSSIGLATRRCGAGQVHSSDGLAKRRGIAGDTSVLEHRLGNAPMRCRQKTTRVHILGHPNGIPAQWGQLSRKVSGICTSQRL